MKRIISVISAVVISLALLASCGGDKDGNIKEITMDTYTERVVEAAKEAAARNSEQEPVVTEQTGERYKATIITYSENESIELNSDIETGEVNGATLRTKSPSETREADFDRFFSQIEMMIRQSDPSATDEQVDEAVERFKSALPDDPDAEGYTGMSALTHMINGVSYFVYYDLTTDPASLELIIT